MESFGTIYDMAAAQANRERVNREPANRDWHPRAMMIHGLRRFE
jgi:hypothetical protein